MGLTGFLLKGLTGFLLKDTHFHRLPSTRSNTPKSKISSFQVTDATSKYTNFKWIPAYTKAIEKYCNFQIWRGNLKSTSQQQWKQREVLRGASTRHASGLYTTPDKEQRCWKTELLHLLGSIGDNNEVYTQHRKNTKFYLNR